MHHPHRFWYICGLHFRGICLKESVESIHVSTYNGHSFTSYQPIWVFPASNRKIKSTKYAQLQITTELRNCTRKQVPRAESREENKQSQLSVTVISGVIEHRICILHVTHSLPSRVMNKTQIRTYHLQRVADMNYRYFQKAFLFFLYMKPINNQSWVYIHADLSIYRCVSCMHIQISIYKTRLLKIGLRLNTKFNCKTSLSFCTQPK